MKNRVLWVVLLISSSAFAAGGPTSVGKVSIGMSKSEFVSAVGITPVDCNTFKDGDGKFKLRELKDLDKDDKTLCFGRFETGSSETINLGNMSYDVIVASYGSSEFVKSIGYGIKGIFVKDKLIQVEISGANVSYEMLSTKYGVPKLFDRRKVEICTNGIGNKFKNQVGAVDAVWNNGKVSAILRRKLLPPHETCTDGLDLQYYIIEERNQLEPIEAAIKNLKKAITKTTAQDSPF
jgi:hypothetical protein